MKTKSVKHTKDELTDQQAIRQLRKIGKRIKALARFSDEELIAELQLRHELLKPLNHE